MDKVKIRSPELSMQGPASVALNLTNHYALDPGGVRHARPPGQLHYSPVVRDYAGHRPADAQGESEGGKTEGSSASRAPRLITRRALFGDFLRQASRTLVGERKIGNIKQERVRGADTPKSRARKASVLALAETSARRRMPPALIFRPYNNKLRQ